MRLLFPIVDQIYLMKPVFTTTVSRNKNKENLQCCQGFKKLKNAFCEEGDKHLRASLSLISISANVQTNSLHFWISFLERSSELSTSQLNLQRITMNTGSSVYSLGLQHSSLDRQFAPNRLYILKHHCQHH